MKEILSKKSLGERIKLLRIKNGHSQDFISKILNLSRSNYSQIELGNQYPSYETLHIIARFYSKTYNWILHGYDLPDWDSPDKGWPLFDLQLNVPVLTPKETKQSQIALVVSADYIRKFQILSYLESLPLLHLPLSYIDKNNIHRAFTTNAVKNKECSLKKDDLLISRNIINYSKIRPDQLYVLVTSEELFVCRICNIIPEKELLICATDYDRVFMIKMLTVHEIWEVVGRLSSMVKSVTEDFIVNLKKLEEMVSELGKKINLLNDRITENKL